MGLYNHFYMSLYTFACVMADSQGNPGTADTLLRTRTDDLFRFAREHRGQVGLWWPNELTILGQPSGWATLTIGSSYFWGTLTLWSALLLAPRRAIPSS